MPKRRTLEIFAEIHLQLNRSVCRLRILAFSTKTTNKPFFRDFQLYESKKILNEAGWEARTRNIIWLVLNSSLLV